MMNQVIIVGRLVDNPKVKETEEGRKTTTITLAIPRNFKNAEGIYEIDFINCTLWDNIAEKTTDYCRKGDIIGVTGRLQTAKIDDKYVLEVVVAERVTFISSSKRED